MKSDAETIVEAIGFFVIGIWRFISGGSARQERKEIKELLATIDSRFAGTESRIGNLHVEVSNIGVEMEGMRSEIRVVRNELHEHAARDERVADAQVATTREVTKQLDQLTDMVSEMKDNVSNNSRS